MTTTGCSEAGDGAALSAAGVGAGGSTAGGKVGGFVGVVEVGSVWQATSRKEVTKTYVNMQILVL
jgi:hypothetical protein